MTNQEHSGKLRKIAKTKLVLLSLMCRDVEYQEFNKRDEKYTFFVIFYNTTKEEKREGINGLKNHITRNIQA